MSIKHFDKLSVLFEQWDGNLFESNIEQVKVLRKNYSYFPYLYAYDDDEENKYLKGYLEAKNDLAAFVAVHQYNVIGISVGLPLNRSLPILKDLPYEDQTIPTYYFGDIVIIKKYWGKGISKSLYAKHIQFAKEQGFKKILALLIEPSSNEPFFIQKFTPSNLWDYFEFKKTSMYVHYSWPTIRADGSIENKSHRLFLYEKNI